MPPKKKDKGEKAETAKENVESRNLDKESELKQQ